MMDKPEVRKSVLDSLIISGCCPRGRPVRPGDQRRLLLDFIQSFCVPGRRKFSRSRYDAFVASQNIQHSQARLPRISIFNTAGRVREVSIAGQTSATLGRRLARGTPVAERA